MECVYVVSILVSAAQMYTGNLNTSSMRVLKISLTNSCNDSFFYFEKVHMSVLFDYHEYYLVKGKTLHIMKPTGTRQSTNAFMSWFYIRYYH